MSKRAIHLARRLTERARSLAGSLVEDRVSPAQARERMRELVAKVLVMEEGITEESKVGLVLDLMPTLDVRRAISDRELQELAASLEARLWR